MKTSELRQKDAAGLDTEIKELQKEAHSQMKMQQNDSLSCKERGIDKTIDNVSEHYTDHISYQTAY